MFFSLYVSNIYGYSLGLFLSLLFLGLLYYEVNFCGDLYAPDIDKKSVVLKFFIFFIHGVLYFPIGASLVGGVENFLFGKSQYLVRSAIPIGEHGRRLNFCASTVVFYNSKSPDDAIKHCVDPIDFFRISRDYSKNRHSAIYTVEYRVSFLGDTYLGVLGK